MKRVMLLVIGFAIAVARGQASVNIKALASTALKSSADVQNKWQNQNWHSMKFCKIGNEVFFNVTEIDFE